ncbi:uncharacterized protein FIESC28_02108 [Fusarium coffeatum]|uniref:Uncharacterized protein n=1 Tax=Fusarium coffeatum TaxID=231269 RepID=A0A366S922_9HYPO|nr:uncharacterized protein FIESC28_02108 [Fusarium coffeatum]RBR25200.1 hypothetical protein FIESC28_02108 [Fusarium coffeatum]
MSPKVDTNDSHERSPDLITTRPNANHAEIHDEKVRRVNELAHLKKLAADAQRELAAAERRLQKAKGSYSGVARCGNKPEDKTAS